MVGTNEAGLHHANGPHHRAHHSFAPAAKCAMYSEQIPQSIQVSPSASKPSTAPHHGGKNLPRWLPTPPQALLSMRFFADRVGTEADGQLSKYPQKTNNEPTENDKDKTLVLTGPT